MIEVDYIQFYTPPPDVRLLELRHDPTNERLLISVDGTSYVLLDGVINRYDPPTSTSEDDRIKPFTLEYEFGRKLYRATIDLTVVPDDNQSTTIDGTNADQIRLVATAMPRISAY